MRYSVDKALVQMPEDWQLNTLISFVKHCVSLVRTELVVFTNTQEKLLSATYNLYSAIQNDVHSGLNVLVFPPVPDEAMDHFEDHVLLLSRDHSRVETRHSILIPDFAIYEFPFVDAEVALTYDSVLIAGTWDHLHLGHKFLLLASLASARTKLYVGFADGPLLVRKRHALVLQSLVIRQARVRKFLDAYKIIFPIEHEFAITTDVVGPSAYLPFDALAVTPETARGGITVNEARVAGGNPQVAVFELPLLETSEVGKLSSTYIREYLVGKAGGDAVIQQLHRFWTEVCRAIEPEIASTWWARLVDLHGQPWRHYHTFYHVFELLQQLDDLSETVSEGEYRELVFACFFHDAIYVPGAPDNEDKSAALFAAFAEEAALDAPLVRQCIEGSKDHVKFLRDAEGALKLFLELDLSILAAAPHRYLQYSVAIREEYCPLVVDEETFKAKRLAFLTAVLSSVEQGSLFTKEEFNQLAAVNIDAEITRLSD